MAATDESLSSFHALFDELIVKKLSASGVEKIRDAAALSFHEPAPLVEAMVEAQKRASASTKLAAFYLVDAIVRHARDVIKRKASGGYAYKDAKAPEGSEAKDGSKQAMMEGAKAFLEAVGGVLQDLSLDAMRGVRADQREKIYKIIDIWTKVEVSDVELLKALRKAVEELEAELGPGETSADAAAAKEASSNSAERKKREAASAARKDKRREAAATASKANDTQAAVTGTKAATTRTPLEGTSSATATPEPTAAPGLPSHLLALLSGNMSSRMSPGAAALSTPPEDGRLSPASAALQSEQPAPPPQPTQPPIVPSTVLSSLANMLGTTTSANAPPPATASGNPALNASQLALLQQLAASGSTPPQRPPQPLPSVSSGASSNAMYARPPPSQQQQQQQSMRRPPPPPQQWTQRPPPPSTQNGGPAPAAVPRPYPPPSSAQSYARPPPTTAHPQPPGKPPPPPFGVIRPLGMVGHKPAPIVAQAQPSTHVASPARNTPPVPAEHSSSSAGVKRSADEAGHEDAKRARSRSPQKAAPAAAQVTANASIGDMSGFNLATFDATKPEAWAELAQRWYNTQGSHPTQQELLWWLMAMQQQQQMMAWSAQAAWSMEAQGGGVATGLPSDAAAYAQPQPQQPQQPQQDGKRSEENGRSFEAREVHTS